MRQDISASRNKALLAESLGLNHPSLLNISILVGFAVSLGWFTDTALHFTQSLFDASAPKLSMAKLWVGLMPFPLLLAITFLRWKWAQNAALGIRAKVEDVQPHEGVVMFLSSLKLTLLERARRGDESVFEEDYFPWMQNKRGLEVHQGHLKKVWLVCSPDSASQFKYFVRFFEGWFPEVAFIQVGGGDGVAFEDLHKLSEVMDGVFQSLPNDIDEVEVIIDITSGTKTATIAGMLTSLVSQHREIQYVLEKMGGGETSYHVKTYKYVIGFFGKAVKRS